MKKPGLNAFTLKIIAITSMTLNHSAHLFENRLPLPLFAAMYAAGGLAFPIMAFLLADGYKKTSNITKYMLRLLWFGLLSLLPFMIVMSTRLNIMFTLLLGLITLRTHETVTNKNMRWIALVSCVFGSAVCDWPVIGVLLIFCYASGSKQRTVLATLLIPILTAAVLAGNNLNQGISSINMYVDSLFMLVSASSIGLILLYNGERGPGGALAKYMFYGYYPAHLTALAAVKLLFL